MTAASPFAPDLILRGGKVITVDSRFRMASAFAVKGGRFVAVGDDSAISRLAGEGTRIVEAAGRPVAPGLIDGHAHMDREGLKKLIYPSLAGCRSIADILDRIAALVRDAAPGEWIVTMPVGDPPNFFGVPDCLAEKRYPNRDDLDRVAPDNPVYIKSIWGPWRHVLPLVSIANTKALERAGVTAATPPPGPSVEIETDPETGEPTGIFVENTPYPIVELSLMAAAGGFSAADRVRGLRESMRLYNAAGTTSVFEGHGVAGEVLGAYQALRRSGEASVRGNLVFSPSWSAVAPAGRGEVLRSWARWLAGRGLGDGMLRVAGLFAEFEGGPEHAVRARANPYTGWAGFHFDAGLPRAALKALLVEAARLGIRVSGIVPPMLGLFAEVDREAPIGDQRWILGHINVLSEDDVARIRDLGLIVTTHTNRYIYKEGHLLKDRLGKSREDDIVPLRRLLDAGVHVSFATDNVPISLWHPVWQAVARKSLYTGETIAPAQRLTREEALRCATAEGAWLSFEEAEKGSIEEGKLADFAVLSDDPLACPEEALRDIKSELTVVGGRVVHEDGDMRPSHASTSSA
ncbi:MAG: amidohydrolase family protein [Alphaproteobacteria bacterium]|nr:amidohydrolase family protein [Alphaproteobacteria bacterium]